MKIINKRRNIVLYYIDLFSTKISNLLLKIVVHITPQAYRNKLTSMGATNSFVNNALGLMLFNAIGGILVLITNVKLANTMGAAMYGIYSYCLAIGEVGANIVRYGRNKTMLRELIQHPENSSELISNTFILGLINLIVFILTVVIFHNQLDIPLAFSYFLLIISPCLMSLDFLPVYESIKLMSWHSIYYLLQKTMFLVGVWAILLMTFEITLLNISIILFFSWFIILIGQYYEIIHQGGINILKLINIKSILKQYKANFLVALSCLLGVAFGPLIRMVLNVYSDSSTVGIYAAGLQLFLVGQFIMHQIGRVGNPMMAELGKSNVTYQKRRFAVKKYLFIMILSTVPFAALLCFAPHYLTDLLFNEEYERLSTILPWFGIYLLAFSVGLVFTQFLISLRKDRVYFTIYISGALITIICALTLIPQYNLLGATISLCLPHSITCLAYAIASYKYLKNAE